MAFIIETANPFEPFNIVKHVLDAPITVREWVRLKFPESAEFPVPTICVFNGQPLMRKDWDRRIESNDVVNFVAVPAGFSTIIAIIIAVVAIAVTIYFTLNRPRIPGAQPDSDPVFSSKGQSNAIRLGEPIEVCYGRNRIYPSYASRPYFEYRDNDQFQFSLFSLGQGYYDIHTIQIGETDIDNYAEVDYEVYEPGDQVTLFPTAVYSAPEANGQRLYAPNEPEYVAPGWVGPFIANPSGTEAYTLQIDVVFPRGLYRQKKSGGLGGVNVTFEMEYRPIDDSGAPLGAYSLFLGSAQTVHGATTTPQRRTFMGPVAAGRYEVRMRRTSDAGLTASYGDEIQWDGLRTYLDEEQNFGNVTLLAVVIRATNNLNSQTQQQFNVIATRKLPIRESGGAWSAPVATRSIIWAFVDVFKATYGGRLGDAFLDWDALEELDALYAEREEYFDWVFRDPVTVWEAAQAVARVGRATPLLAGSLLTCKRDGPLTVPVAMFNQENVLSGSFEWNIKLWDPDEYDSVRVEYTEPATGYKQEVVVATLPGGTSDHPEDIRFPGIQDRTHAYREGLYIMATRRYLRENVTFTTGLEGLIPTFGDLIAIVHDVPNWGQGGYIVHAEEGPGSNVQLWLSEPVSFEETGTYSIYLRKSNSDLLGPLTAFETSDPKQVIVEIESGVDVDYLLDGRSEPMLFIFGPAAQVTKYLRVVVVQPQGNEAVQITAVTERSEVHSFDEDSDLVPSDLDQHPNAPVPPDLPEIDQLILTQIDADLYIVQASWTAAFGAQYYVVQLSTDGTNWTEKLTTTRTNIQLQVVPGPLWVRVAAVNTGQGPWIEETLGVVHILELTLATPWDQLDWGISWMLNILADSFTVKIYDNTTPSTPVLIATHTVTRREFFYEHADAVEDMGSGNLVRDLLVTVTPVFPPDDPAEDPEDVDSAEIELSNPIPSPPIHPDYVLHEDDSPDVTYRFFWDVPDEDDLIRVAIWVSETSGFDPEVVPPEYDFTAGSPGPSGIPDEAFIAIELDMSGEHPTLYWRVALFDVWGNEIDTNISEEFTIPAYP